MALDRFIGTDDVHWNAGIFLILNLWFFPYVTLELQAAQKKYINLPLAPNLLEMSVRVSTNISLGILYHTNEYGCLPEIKFSSFSSISTSCINRIPYASASLSARGVVGGE